MYVYALELPPDLVAKLHTNLRIAFLYERVNWGVNWETEYQRPLPIKYYEITKIDTRGLYNIDAYDILVMNEGYERLSGQLTTEQMEIIVKFVKNGGGLIVSSFVLSESLKTLLFKLGIIIIAVSEQRETIKKAVIPKDGKIMVDHPVTVGVEKINANYGGYSCAYYTCYRNVVTAVEIDNGVIFIKSPFIAVAKSYGSGRVIYIGGAEISEDLSGLRLGVDAVEWVAGYTPPEWSPPDTSIIGSLREENARLKGLLAGYEELEAKHESIKVDYEKLNAYLKELKANYELLKGKYDGLKTDYEKLMSDYRDLKSKYESIIKAPPQTQVIYSELTYLFLTTTIAFAISTIYFARKRKTK
jgi:uncharacterized membrane protein